MWNGYIKHSTMQTHRIHFKKMHTLTFIIVLMVIYPGVSDDDDDTCSWNGKHKVRMISKGDYNNFSELSIVKIA